MTDNAFDPKPLPEKPEPIVNPEDAETPKSTEGDNEGEQDDPPADPPPGNGGDHPTKKPPNP